MVHATLHVSTNSYKKPVASSGHCAYCAARDGLFMDCVHLIICWSKYEVTLPPLRRVGGEMLFLHMHAVAYRGSLA